MMDMFDSDHDKRTLPASPRRRGLARESGSVPRSPEVPATLVLVLFTCGLVLIGPSLLAAGTEFVAESLKHLQTGPARPELVEPSAALMKLCRIAAVWLLLAAAVAVIGNVVQFGLLFAPQVIQPDPERLSPRRGLQRMFSEFHPRALAVHCGRLLVMAVITGWLVWSIRPDLVHPQPAVLGDSLADAVIVLGSCLTGGAAIISVVQALMERMRHEARLRLTPREAREEQQLNEADPAVARRRRETQRQFVTSVSGRSES
jgi:flagellar biosynthetic protein FlhB